MENINLENKYKSCIIQLTITKTIYNYFSGQEEPINKIIYGTGCIVDINNNSAVVLTTAENIIDSSYISGMVSKLGYREIKLIPIGICRERNIGLCRIDELDVKLITRDIDDKFASSLKFDFGDHLNLSEHDEIMAIGYHLNHKIKYINGNIIGFNISIHDDNNEDSVEREPVYFQVNAFCNMLNLGSPIFNKDGKLVGILASIDKSNNNIGNIIPSRTILSVYNSILKDSIVRIPTLSLKWDYTNPVLMECCTGKSGNYGIYISDVLPDSCIDVLKPGDIIRNIKYFDPFWVSDNNFDVNKQNFKYDDNPLNLVTCYFDRNGEFTIYKGIIDEDKDDLDSKLVSNRLFGFSEILDMIPPGVHFEMKIWRDSNIFNVVFDYEISDYYRIKYIYPKLQHNILKTEYDTMLGMTLANLNYNNFNLFKDQFKINPDLFKFKKCVIVTYIHPGTDICKYKNIKAGHIIDTINGKSISSISEIKDILNSKTKTKYTIILTLTSNLFCIKN